MTPDQLTIFDLLHNAAPATVNLIIPRRFSATIDELNPPEPGIDVSQWGDQLQKVYAVMKDGRWRSLAEVAYHASAPEASVSARIRDLKKKGILHEKRRAIDGKLYQYRLTDSARPV